MEDRKSFVYLLPLIFIISVIPLIFYLKVMPLSGVVSYFWENKYFNFDFYSYYKAMALIICCFILFFIIIIRRLTEEYRFKRLYYYLPILGYFILIIMSTIKSQFMSISIIGFPDRYEGTLVLISYLIILFASINFINNEKQIKIVLFLLTISAVIISIIGIFEYTGFDLLNIGILRKFVLHDQYNNLNRELINNINNLGKYSISSTLYNPNNVGSYMALLLPISVAIYIYSNKIYKKIITGIISCIIYLNLLGCHSRAGLVGSIIGILIMFFIQRKNIKINFASIIILTVCFFVIFIGMNFYSGGRIAKSVSSLNPDTEQNMLTYGNVLIKDIKFNGPNAVIITDNETFKFSFKNNRLSFYNGNDQKLEVVSSNNNEYKFIDPQYKNYRYILNNDPKVFTLLYCNKRINFYIDSSIVGLIAEQGRVYNKITVPEKFGFSGKEYIGSFRGYIWSRSIPILKQTIILGKGPDTYAIYFPQHDYVGKLNYLGSASMLVDKPHDMYLQIAINTGVLSLIAFLIFFGMYIVNSLKLYWGRLNNNLTSIIGAAILCAVIGYLIAGIFNDSVVSVAPVFWALTGMGISCNYIIQKSNIKC